MGKKNIQLLGLVAFFFLTSHSIAQPSVISAKIPVIDVMVLYNSDTFDKVGLGKIKTRAVADIEYANLAMKNSKARARFRLVHVGEDSVPISDDLRTMINKVIEDPKVGQLRKKYGADFVSLYANNGKVDGTCGVGYMPEPFEQGVEPVVIAEDSKINHAFNVVNYSCGLAVMVHELGHNMGLGHADFVDQGVGSLWHWGRGHGVFGSFSTVMGYGANINAKQLPIFSNPRLSACEGQPCGVEGHSDSVKNINRLAKQFADYMPSVVASQPKETQNKISKKDKENRFPSPVNAIHDVGDDQDKKKALEDDKGFEDIFFSDFDQDLGVKKND